MIKVVNYEQLTNNIFTAIQSGDENKVTEAFKAFANAVSEQAKQDAADLNNGKADAAIMAQRGYRQLTSDETKFYEKLIEGGKSNNPRQAWTDLIENGGMPETIIEEVYRNLKQEHPLLSAIDFQDVKYLTKWIISKGNVDRAIWGPITEEFKKQLAASFEIISIEQAKLSAFVLMPKDLLDLGPTFLDNYVRTMLVEAEAGGLEYGFATGKGVNGEPIGMDRDIHKGVEFNTTDGYPQKEAIKITSFAPKEYGELVAMLMKDEQGNLKKVTSVQLFCNPIDQVKKIMPATTMLTSNGEYVTNIFPYPTDVIPTSRGIEEGYAILGIAKEYKGLFGSKKNGAIEYSDENQFIEDIRVYASKIRSAGRAVDNTSFILLDISELKELSIYNAVASANANVSEPETTEPETTEPETTNGDNDGESTTPGV